MALNSYRLSGGYGFAEATGLSEADCCWTASQYLGADRAPVPTQIGEYVAHMGTVAPTDKVSHGQDSTWNLLTIFENPFVDAVKDEYYYDGLMSLTEKGIVKGTSETTFSPDEIGTRAQVVTMLWRAAGCPEPTADTTSFTDVSEGDYYVKAVLWAVSEKVALGVTSTTFAPDDSCTRAQLVTFIFRAMK